MTTLHTKLRLHANDPDFEDGFHCYLNLPGYNLPYWKRGVPPTPEITMMEVSMAMGKVGLEAVYCKDVGATLEWAIKFETIAKAEAAVNKPFILRNVKVESFPYFGNSGPRIFFAKHLGSVTMAKLTAAVHAHSLSHKFKFRKEKVGKCEGDECLLYFDQPSSFKSVTLKFGSKNFNIVFLPCRVKAPCNICGSADHDTNRCGFLFPVPCLDPSLMDWYDTGILDHI